MLFGRILIALNCILFIALAVATLWSPAPLFSAIGILAESNSGLIELQVILAGSLIGFAVVAGSGIFSEEKVLPSLRRLAIINGSWAFVRLIALAITSADSMFTVYYLIYECVMLVLLVGCFFFNRHAASRKIFGSIDPTL